MLLNYSKARGVDIYAIMTPDYQQDIASKYCYQDWNSILAAIGRGALKEGQVLGRLEALYEKDHPTILSNEEIIAQIAESNQSAVRRGNGNNGGITVKGMTDLSVRFSKCCSPVPGDEIVGFVTRGRGISIHRTDCINIMALPADERSRLIEASWAPGSLESHTGSYEVEIRIYANDRSGLLADISRIFTEKNISLIGVNTRVNKQQIATIMLAFEIHGREELESICDKIRTVQGVVDIERAGG